MIAPKHLKTKAYLSAWTYMELFRYMAISRCRHGRTMPTWPYHDDMATRRRAAFLSVPEIKRCLSAMWWAFSFVHSKQICRYPLWVNILTIKIAIVILNNIIMTSLFWSQIITTKLSLSWGRVTMKRLKLKANSKPVSKYYREIKNLAQLHLFGEGAVSPHFL